MFYYLDGRITHIDHSVAVIDCGGIGYACNTSMNTISGLKIGEKVKLYTRLIVREDSFDIYGFSSQEELNCFLMLIGISGVGPKAAVSILSCSTPAKLAIAIVSGDEKAITSAQGVGKKLAARIILELKDKLAKSQGIDAGMIGQSTGSSNASEAAEALTVLGYSRSEAAQAISGAKTGSSTEEIIRYALKNLVLPY